MNKNIIISKENKIAFDYLIDSFVQNTKIKFKISKSENYNIIKITTEEIFFDDFLHILAKSIVVSKKFYYLFNEFKDFKFDYATITCFCALLYFDIESEIEKVKFMILKDDTISVDGTFLFKMQKMAEEWEELKNIGLVLTFDEIDKEDLYNIATFMISTRSNKKSLFLAQYPNIMLANVTDGIVIDRVKIFENCDFDLISAVVSESPNEIIVEKKLLKSCLIESLSKIVKVKEL